MQVPEIPLLRSIHDDCIYLDILRVVEMPKCIYTLEYKDVASIYRYWVRVFYRGAYCLIDFMQSHDIAKGIVVAYTTGSGTYVSINVIVCA